MWSNSPASLPAPLTPPSGQPLTEGDTPTALVDAAGSEAQRTRLACALRFSGATPVVGKALNTNAPEPPTAMS